MAIISLSVHTSLAQQSCRSLFPSGVGHLTISQLENLDRNTHIFLTLNKDIIPKDGDGVYQSFQASRGIWLLGWNFFKVKITFHSSNKIPQGTIFRIDSLDEVFSYDGHESAYYMSSDYKKYKYAGSKQDFLAAFDLEIDGASKNIIKDLTVNKIQEMLGHIFTIHVSEE